MSVPKISVVLPARDAESTLAEALESLRLQTFSDFEVVVVDDGSTDGTAAVARAFAARDPRFFLFANPGRGLVDALNAGVARARAPLIGRMDGDDLSHPERFAAQLTLLGEDPALGVVACLADSCGTRGETVTDGMARYLAWSNALTRPEQIARERFVESPVVHPTVIMRRELLTAVGGYRDGPFPEDYDLWLRLLAQGVRFAKVERTLFTWRDHQARTTRTDSRYARERLRALKVNHLLQGPLAGGPPVILWGAGLEGKPLLRALRDAGVHVSHAVEMDRRKIGNVIHGAAVISVDELDAAIGSVPGAIILAAVGVPSARPLIREALVCRNLIEGWHFFFLC